MTTTSKVLARLVPALVALLIAAAPVIAAPVDSEDGVIFTLNDAAATAVFIAGDFNGWSATDVPLTSDGNGLWSVTVKLSPGTHEYKFVVDGDWREDPENGEKKSDPFGGSNSVVTINADGALATGAVAAAPKAVVAQEPAAASDTSNIKVGAPRAVDGGIAFTYRDNGAATVNLAGTFNGWSADQWPLTSDGNGNWVVVKELEAGLHEYKFVVDGNWVADPENPDTQSDPYGGVNSAITVDEKGQLTAMASGGETAAAPAANNTLNAKVTIDGRYLTRFEYAKNVGIAVGDEIKSDPRLRLQRPTQAIDLNFTTEVSETATTFMRMRLDSDQNIIQNNVAAFLDEANLMITPKNFTLKAYWNQEVFTGEDILKLGGDVDLPGTIMHDHLDYGKGSAGALFDANPFGVKTRLFFANIHNHDYYNDPDLFDNVGEDKMSLRFSREVGNFEVGLPFYAERALVWMDFGEIVSQTDTGIPALNDHLANTNDTSTWFETDNYRYTGGLEMRYRGAEQWNAGAEVLFRNSVQRFATGNQAGQNNSNGAMEIPFHERDEIIVAGELNYTAGESSHLRLLHQSSRMDGGNPDQRFISYSFEDQATANKKVFFSIGDSPAEADLDSTELTWDWERNDRSATVWLRRASRDLDYGAIGRTAPEDSLVTTHTESAWYLSGRFSTGVPSDKWGQIEVEAGYQLADRGVAGITNTQTEMILRYDRKLTRNVGFIADLRFVKYDQESDAAETASPNYFNPFVGFRYAPIKKLKLVAAYGVDPMDYSIDYNGRQVGRWMHRQNYLFDNPGASALDAENDLKNAQVITLRAQLLF